MRIPAIVRCPSKVPAGVVTEEMLSAHDWYKTAAALAGAFDKVPTDRWTASMCRRSGSASEKTGRETLLFFGSDGSLMSSKRHIVKAVFRHIEGIDKPIPEPKFPMFFDLGRDPGREVQPV
jgi:arylsulfatase A-like enzyme